MRARRSRELKSLAANRTKNCRGDSGNRVEGARSGTAGAAQGSTICPAAQSRHPSARTVGPLAPWTYYPINRQLNDFQLIEEIGNFERRGIRPVRAMNCIPLDIAPELFADGARLGLCRIGSSHDFAKLFDGVVGFEDHRNDWTFGHELDETAEKRPFFVNVIKALSLLF